jgi:MFS family permease
MAATWPVRAVFCIILSMYGGGFATVPAYLADLFGTQMVGAIHGRLLTAWAAAGVLGPVLINYIREYQIAHGVAKAQAYDVTMYVLAGLLVVGFLCNPDPPGGRQALHDRRRAELRRRAKLAHAAAHRTTMVTGTRPAAPWRVASGGDRRAVTLLAWLAVGIPLLIGVWMTLQKAIVLFKSLFKVVPRTRSPNRGSPLATPR